MDMNLKGIYHLSPGDAYLNRMSIEDQPGQPENLTPTKTLRLRSVQTVSRVALMLIAIGTLLYLGRQIAHLYVPLADPANVETGYLGLFDTSEHRTPEVQLGNGRIALTRFMFSGDRHSAAQALQLRCRDVASQCKIPKTPATQSEIDLIRSIGKDKEFTGPNSNIIVKSIDSMNPTVVGMIQSESPSASTDHSTGNHNRIVAWGFATEDQIDTWNIRIVRRIESTLARDSLGTGIELPSGSRKIMQMQVDEGNLILAFESDQTIDNQIKFFDDLFSRKGWDTGHKWQTIRKGSRTCYRNETPEQIRTVEIRLRQSTNLNKAPVHVSGIISVSSQQYAVKH